MGISNFLTQKEFADFVGISTPRVTELIKEGKLNGAIKVKGKRKLIDLRKAQTILSQNLNRSNSSKILSKFGTEDKEDTEDNGNNGTNGKMGNNGKTRNNIEEGKVDINKPIQSEHVTRSVGTGGLSLHEAQTYQARFKTALLKLELDQKTKKLVDAEEFRIGFFNKARTARDALLNIPSRISAILAAETDEGKVYQILEDELRRAMEEISK